MTTYTPKIGSMGEPWMCKDPQGGWISLADHEEAMRQANAARAKTIASGALDRAGGGV